MAYFVGNWRPLSFIYTIPALLRLVVANPWVLSESPRWLLLQGRLAEAEAVLRKAAQLNKTQHKLPTNLSHVIARVYQSECKRSVRQQGQLASVRRLFSSTIMLKMMAVRTIITVTIGILVMIIPLQSDSSGSPFVYMVVVGIVEVPAYIFPAPLTTKFGRRPVIAGLLVTSCLLLLGLVALEFLQLAHDWPTVVVLISAYMLLCATFQVNWMYSSELYPTEVRVLGTSINYVMNNVGYSIPPFVSAALPAEKQWCAVVLYSGLGLVSAALVYLLPETNKKPLPETIEQTETVWRKSKQKKQMEFKGNSEPGNPDLSSHQKY
ncbi:solute carrier family 22 member 21-like [Hyalella azteca]|uniref:Solute carrier family 22 member 21-like n=1 Tax=Hyalella azteca TaxID=294128 RepID=A0A8B7PA87_HYAAZ|nr:solute carrier family 22 member 21-like [Hyalella azteca]